MNNNPRVFIIAAVWFASVAAAFFIGNKTAAPSSASTFNEQDSASKAGAQNAEPIPGNSSFGDAQNIDKGAKPSVASLIARARLTMGTGMGGMMNLRSMLRAIAPITELDEAQVQEALAEVERTVREPQQRMMLYTLLLGQWAETDGKAAMTYAKQKLEAKSPYEMGITSSILGSWAHRDPDAAWRWFQTEHVNDGDERLQMMTTSAVFSGMAASNLDTALGRLGGLDEMASRGALQGIASSASDDASRRRLLDRSLLLPDDQRAAIRSGVLNQWAMSDPESAIQWLHTLPAEEQKPLRNSASNMVLMMNPPLGAQMMLEGAESKEKPQIYDRIAGQWAQQDPRAAGEWLLAQPQGPELDNARRTFAAVVSRRDPVVAMDWAQSVQDPVQREQSIGQIYQIWRVKDSSAADKALLGSSLSPEQLKQFRETPLPNTVPVKTITKSYGF